MPLNVFEHQQFLLRRPPTSEHPLGERIKRSYRDIITGPDEPLRFDYPLEYFNVAALGLCAALTQALFEPVTRQDLEKRLQTPISNDEFENAVKDQRDVFSIDGEVRFMQGKAPERDAKGRVKNIAHLYEKLNVMTSDFLNRPDQNWVVSMDQIPLLAFSRSTFYEKSAGRGYLTGTSGDLEVRTYLSDKNSLRRSIWLNVLIADRQSANEFVPVNSPQGYDEWMWQIPPQADIPQGQVSLRAGLFWMVANNYIVIDEVETPAACIATGEIISGQAGVGVVTASTGIGYGVKEEREKGPAVRMSFFTHPNAPIEERLSKEKIPYPVHISVDEVSGLLGHIGGLFFSGGSQKSKHHIAPVLDQFNNLPPSVRSPINLICFGFHMLSSKRNVHGGYEYEQFDYPVLDTANRRIFTAAQSVLVNAADNAEEIRRLLIRSVQLCMMVETDSSVDDQKHFKFKFKSHLENGRENKSFVRDLGREYWFSLRPEIGILLKKIEAHHNSYENLLAAIPAISSWWKRQAALNAEAIFQSIFDQYSNSTVHLPATYTARNRFYFALKEMGIKIHHPEVSQTPLQQPTGLAT